MSKLKFTLIFTSIIMINSVSAATQVNLEKNSDVILKKNFPSNANTTRSSQLKATYRHVDLNQTTHTRMQQTYSGYSVWGATAIIHTPKNPNKTLQSFTANVNGTASKLDGKIYENIDKDLAPMPAYVNDEQKAKALSLAKNTFAQKTKRDIGHVQDELVKTIIFVDDKDRARYAFHVSFYVDDGESGAHRPNMIIDAETLQIYRNWDKIFYDTRQHLTLGSLNLKPIEAGGIGGNEKSGENVYDGSSTLPALPMLSTEQEVEILPGQRIKVTTCYLMNDDVVVRDVPFDQQIVGSVCAPWNKIPWLSLDRNGTRWKADEINGGFSPSLDAFYTGNVVQKLYHDWYGVPALTQEDHKTPMQLIMRVHYGRNFDNAFWDGRQMTFGDGGRIFYPLVSLDITAHEVSHGFTQQHSDIDTSINDMAALHEAFSDMASVSAEFYATGKIHWELGRSVMKKEGALRYMDRPSKDGISIDSMAEYTKDTEPHAAAGVFNRAFYLLANSKGWDVHKAFDVMVKANMDYWSSSTKDFTEAACGVLNASHDYQYKPEAIYVAFSKVGIDLSEC